MSWVSVAKADDIPENGALALDLENKPIAVFRSGKDFYAIDNICPHKCAPLAEGSLENGQLTCAWHAWSFDIKTGECVTVPGVRIKTYPVKIEKDILFVRG